MQKTIWALALISPLALAACGDSDLERGLTGAAAGAVIADVTQNNIGTGALIGAGVGVLSDDVKDILD